MQFQESIYIRKLFLSSPSFAHLNNTCLILVTASLDSVNFHHLQALPFPYLLDCLDQLIEYYYVLEDCPWLQCYCFLYLKIGNLLLYLTPHDETISLYCVHFLRQFRRSLIRVNQLMLVHALNLSLLHQVAHQSCWQPIPS